MANTVGVAYADLFIIHFNKAEKGPVDYGIKNTSQKSYDPN
jgi:hypothetical protein